MPLIHPEWRDTAFRAWMGYKQLVFRAVGGPAKFDGISTMDTRLKGQI